MKKSKLEVAVKICRRGQDYETIENFIREWIDIGGIDYVCVGSALEQINDPGMREHPCKYFDNNFMVIRRNLRVVLCAYNNDATNKYMLSPGVLKPEDNLLSFYNNVHYTRLRNDQNNGIFHPPCSTCGFAYTGSTMQGIVHFRGNPKPIYWHQDYYNQFFSGTKKWKENSNVTNSQVQDGSREKSLCGVGIDAWQEVPLY